MIPVAYFRSSSYNTWNNCEQQFYLAYTLGMDNPAGKWASMGNAVHKALEIIALQKIAMQDGETEFDEENLGHFKVKNCDPDRLIEQSFEWHHKKFPHKDWNYKRDLESCRSWMKIVLADPLYSPLRRHIIKAEQSFDFEIREPWAKYHYVFEDGTVFDGYLRMKGTMDLVSETLPDHIEVVDWKTGASKKDFATGKEKDFWSLHSDGQLRIYHMASHQLFPTAKDIQITIYFVRLGGADSITLGPEDLDDTKEMIRSQFKDIIKTSQPRLTPGPPWSDHYDEEKSKYKCFRLCGFSKPAEFSDGKPVCQFIKEKIEKVGIEKVTNEMADLNKLNRYSDGGGKYVKGKPKI